MDEKMFIETLEKSGITLTDQQLAQFDMYFQLLIEWNEKVNLTAITDKEEVYLKHFSTRLLLVFIMTYNIRQQFVILVQEQVFRVFH